MSAPSTFYPGWPGPFAGSTTPVQPWQQAQQLQQISDHVWYNGGYVNGVYVGTPQQYQSDAVVGPFTIFAEAADSVEKKLAERAFIPMLVLHCQAPGGLKIDEFVTPDFKRLYVAGYGLAEISQFPFSFLLSEWLDMYAGTAEPAVYDPASKSSHKK